MSEGLSEEWSFRDAAPNRINKPMNQSPLLSRSVCNEIPTAVGSDTMMTFVDNAQRALLGHKENGLLKPY